MSNDAKLSDERPVLVPIQIHNSDEEGLHFSLRVPNPVDPSMAMGVDELLEVCAFLEYLEESHLCVSSPQLCIFRRMPWPSFQIKAHRGPSKDVRNQLDSLDQFWEERRKAQKEYWRLAHEQGEKTKQINIIKQGDLEVENSEKVIERLTQERDDIIEEKEKANRDRKELERRAKKSPYYSDLRDRLVGEHNEKWFEELMEGYEKWKSKQVLARLTQLTESYVGYGD